MAWQIQSEDGELNHVIARSVAEGPQTIVREGNEVAVVMSISDFRRLTSDDEAPNIQKSAENKRSLRDFLLSPDGPFSDELAVELDRIERERDESIFRDIEL